MLVWSALSESMRREALSRPVARASPALRATVERIFAEIERDGEAGVERWALLLDKFAPRQVTIDAPAIRGARGALLAEDLFALDAAAANVTRYHEAIKPMDERVEIGAGIVCERRWRPIDVCGLYIPGGSAPLFSTLLMLAMPARIAGVPRIVVATPPNRDGEAAPIMIAAAAACGLDGLWLLGGAQAVAAMTFGAGMPKSNKLFGPGNSFVAEAKRLAASIPGGPRIDAPAGPSELMVIADEMARPDYVAADLLSQAEHDAEAQVLLVTTSRDLAAAVQAQLPPRLNALPRAAIASRSMEHARCILVDDLTAAAEVANLYAPEHLSLQTQNPTLLTDRINHAGAIFVGPWSAEAFGDYICGPSHVLPTDGAARSWSGVSVASFMKCVGVQTLSEVGARALRTNASRLARLEGLEAHALAAEIRGA